MGKFSALEVLTEDHDVSLFDCGEPVLTDWLKRTALKNQRNNASKTFVVCSGNRVVAYFALATGGIDRASAPSQVARQMPNPIPVLVLGRLAVDVQFQGQRLGSHLLKEAMVKTLRVAAEVGVRALLVHAIDETARGFYLKHGLLPSPVDPMTLMISVKSIAANVP